MWIIRNMHHNFLLPYVLFKELLQLSTSYYGMRLAANA